MDGNNGVGESLPPVVDSRQLEDDLDSLRMLFTWLTGITIIVAAGVGYIVIKNWVQDSMVSGPPAELLADQAAFNQLIQLDEVGGLTGQGVTMCIVDSGIDMSHEALKNVKLAGWRDFIGNKDEAYDDQGHGTMMAGIIVAGDGMRSVAPNVELFVAKALAKNGSGSDTGVSDAIDWCVGQGADIISLSLGGAPGIVPSAFEGSSSSSAARDAIDAGILVVAAAGNDGDEASDDNVDSPGGEEDVICVGAVDKNGKLWMKSSKGDNNGNIWPVLLPRNDPDKKPELVAPGMDIPVIIPDNRYGYASGTSASTAFVSGALALLLEDYPDLQHDGSAGGKDTVENIKQLMMDSVHPKSGQTDHDDHYGYGLLQIRALLDAASN
jgi:subtilisin family serine protease